MRLVLEVNSASILWYTKCANFVFMITYKPILIVL